MSDPLQQALDSISDGIEIDWSALEAETPQASRPRLQSLRAIAAIARAHETSTGRPIRSVPFQWGFLRVDAFVASGANGDVYSAWDPRLERVVALKLLRSDDDAEDQASVAISEGRLLARVRHPNVITVYGAERIDGRVGIWMELVEGWTLEADVRERGPLPPADVVHIGVELCRALTAVHRAGLLHRDLKAQNVLRHADGRVMLVDLGAGRQVSDVAADLAGTPLYLAPEILEGEAASVASDVYGLGVLLYYLATGSFPIHGRTVDELRKARRTSLREQRPDLPARFVEAVDRAIDPDASGRFQRADAFETALTAAARSLDTAGSVLPPANISPVGSDRSVRRGHFILVGFAAAVAAGLFLWRYDQPALDSQPALDFQSRKWALVLPFENHTGEESLDGTVEAALGRELTNSQVVNVVSRPRVDDALGLMKKPVDTALDRALAREICLRDRGIRFYIAGRVDRIGTGYILTASIMNPADDRMVANVIEDAPDQRALAGAIHSLSNRLRLAFGESRAAIRRTDEQLQGVATPSIAALRFYSRSYDLGSRRQWPAARDVVAKALAEDPAFAAAHIWLAWCLDKTRAPDDQVRRAAARAVELSRGATMWERHWIEGIAHTFANESDLAIASYKALLDIRPDHFWALDNIAYELSRSRAEAEAIPYTVAASDLRPNDGSWAVRAFDLLVRAKNWERARFYGERITALRRQGASFDRAWLPRFLPAEMALARRDFTGVGASLDAIAATIPGLADPERSRLSHTLWQWYRNLGQCRKALQVADLITDRNHRFDHRARTHTYMGDVDGLRADLQQITRGLEVPTLPSVLIQAGLLEDARRLIDEIEKTAPASSPKADQVTSWRGLLALRTGDVSGAIRQLEAAHPRAAVYQAYRAEYLAEALAAHGDTARAISTLEQALRQVTNVAQEGNGGNLFVMEIELPLAELYHTAGRISEARALEAEMSDRLAVADPDFPFLVRFRKLQATR